MSETHSIVPINRARYRLSKRVVDKLKAKHRLRPEDVCAVPTCGDCETGSKSGSTVAKAYRDMADYEVITAFGPND